MKTKLNEQEKTQEIELTFNPSLGSLYSVVTQTMPDGTKKPLGSVERYEFNQGSKNDTKTVFYCSDFDRKSICPPPNYSYDVKTEFEKYAKRLARKEKTKEIKQIRLNKGKNKGKGRER